jgi:carotenoid cleavage dioxygenase-like enzyme
VAADARPQPTDNANVHVARLCGEYVALTEAPRRVAFDPVTLETRGEFTFDDDLTEYLAAAHVRHDPHRGETVGYATQFGLDTKIHVYRLPDGERRRRLIASLDAGGPGYIHDVSVTADHVVLVEPPLDIALRRALAPGTEGVFDLFEWNPDRGTRVVVLDRESGAVRLDATIEPVFVFHHINAYDDGGTGVLDVVDSADADIVGSMTLDQLDRAGFPNVPDDRPDGRKRSRQGRLRTRPRPRLSTTS